MIVATLAGALCATAQTGITTAATSPASTVILAVLHHDKNTLDAELVGRQGNKLFYREQGGPKEASLTMSLDKITGIDFEFKFEDDTFSRALSTRNWSVVAATLWPMVTPLMPYLDIKDNNAVSYAYTLANAMVKVADGFRKTRTDDKASRLYIEADKLLNSLAAAEWFEDADSARLKAVLCQIALTNYPQAELQFKAAHVPEIGDAAMGLYWYTQAILKQARGETRNAMNAVIRSLVFENKDVDVFPDALMLSGRLYEALMEPYRARDVYFEIAKLFPDTEWAKSARERLQYVMDKGLTKSKEKSDIEVVFFGLNEDVNARATAFLKGDDRAPIMDESDTTIDVDEADMQSGKKGEAAADTDATAPPPDPGDAPAVTTSAADAARKAGRISAGARVPPKTPVVGQ